VNIRSRFATAITLAGLLLALLTPANAQRQITLRQRIYTYGCISGSAPGSAGAKKYSVSTGNQFVDNAIRVDISELNRQFGVFVPVYFENTDVKNAYFTNQKFPELIQEDTGSSDANYTGSVFIAAGLWNDEYIKNQGFALPAIMAHEFAHAMQYSRGFPYGGKWLELHADYMAGWFAGHRGRFAAQNDIGILQSFFNKGDYDFFSQRHHGTPQERANAFFEGFRLNRQFNAAFGGQAYDYGLQYVRALGAR
jgi:hypothetical protein